MAAYTATAAANVLQRWDTAPLRQRVQILLVRQAAIRLAVATDSELTYIRRVAAGAAAIAAAIMPVVIAEIDVAAPGTDQDPLLPTDAELEATVALIWPFLAT